MINYLERKKPVTYFKRGSTVEDGICPKCGSLIFIKEVICPCCGQPIDWSLKKGKRSGNNV